MFSSVSRRKFDPKVEHQSAHGDLRLCHNESLGFRSCFKLGNKGLGFRISGQVSRGLRLGINTPTHTHTHTHIKEPQKKAPEGPQPPFQNLLRRILLVHCRKSPPPLFSCFRILGYRGVRPQDGYEEGSRFGLGMLDEIPMVITLEQLPGTWGLSRSWFCIPRHARHSCK